MSGLQQWLKKEGLEEFQALFEAEQLDLDIIHELTDQDLIRLGLKLGPRKRILRAIADRQANQRGRVAPRVLERRQLSVLFCDLVGSTTLASQLDIEDFRHIIRAYQDNAVRAIKRWDGVVSRYMGDGLMAYFGYPQAQDRDAERAVRAGLDIVASMSEKSATAELRVRVGIATGLVVVGDLLGEDSVEELAALGAAPNLAARLQSIAEPNSVVIAQTTYNLTRNAIETVSLGKQPIKGFTSAEAIYRVTGLSKLTNSRESMESPLLGRSEEINRLQSLWQQVANSNTAQTVFLIGEPGIGKSHIAHALGQSAITENPSKVTHVVLQASPFHDATALHPFVEEVSRRAGITTDEKNTDTAQKLEKIFAIEGNGAAAAVARQHQVSIFNLLARDIPAHLPPLLENPGQRKEAGLLALEHSFQTFAHQGPLLVLFEDAHWIDPTSLELLQRLMLKLSELPVMFLITARPEFSTDSLHAPIAGPPIVHMELAGLPRDAIEALILQNTNDKPLPKKLFEDIINKTDGVPLFVEELTRSVVESGVVVLVGRYEYADANSASAIPSSLQDSLMSRIDRLGPAKAVIQFASALGRSFRSELLREVSSLSIDDYADAIAKILGAGLIYRENGASEEPRLYTFKHALIQDIAYESMLRDHRTSLHNRIADILLEKGNSPAQIVASHLEAGGREREAIDYWQLAGNYASGNSHLLEAISHMDRGIAIAQRIDADGLLELPLQVVRAACLRGTAGLGDERTGAALERARELCVKHDDHTQLIPALNGLYAFYMEHSQHEKARACASEILFEAQQQNNENFRMVGLRALGALDFHAARYDDAIDGLNTAMTIYNVDTHGGDAATYGTDHKLTASCFISFGLLMKGKISEAMAVQDEALRHSYQLNHKLSICQGLAFAALQAILIGDNALAGKHAGNLATTGSDFAMLHGAALCLLGVTQFESASDPHAALAQMHKGGEKWWGTGADNYRSWAESVMARAYAVADDSKNAWQLLNLAKERVPGSGETWAEPEIIRTEAWLHHYYSDEPNALETARKLYDVAHQLALDQQSPLWQLRVALWSARLHVEQGQSNEAINLLTPACDSFVHESCKPADAITAAQLLASLITR